MPEEGFNHDAARKIIESWDRDVEQYQPIVSRWISIPLACFEIGVGAVFFMLKCGYTAYAAMRMRIAEYRISKAVSKMVGVPVKVKHLHGSLYEIIQVEQDLVEASNDRADER